MFLGLISFFIGVILLSKVFSALSQYQKNKDIEINKVKMPLYFSIFLLVFGLITITNNGIYQYNNYYNKIEGQLSAKAHDYCFDKVKDEYKDKGPYILSLKQTDFNKEHNSYTFQCPNSNQIYMASFKNKNVNLKEKNEIKIIVLNKDI